MRFVVIFLSLGHSLAHTSLVTSAATFSGEQSLDLPLYKRAEEDPSASKRPRQDGKDGHRSTRRQRTGTNEAGFHDADGPPIRGSEGTSRQHAQRTDADIQRLGYNDRLATVVGLREMPEHIQKPIIREVFLDRVMDRVWYHSKEKSVDDYHTWQAERHQMNAHDRAAYDDFLRHTRAAMLNAVQQHMRQIPLVAHRTLLSRVRDNPPLQPHEREAVLHTIEDQRRSIYNTIRDSLRHNGAVHGVGSIPQVASRRAHHYLSIAMEHEAFETDWRTHFPDPQAHVHGEYERLAREHIARIDQRAAGIGRADAMRRVQAVLNRDTVSGVIEHERAAAKVGAIYSQGFFPETKKKEVGDDWDLLPPHHRRIQPPDFMREGYVRREFPQAPLRRANSIPKALPY